MSDGDYQSCLSCDVYLTCSNGLTYDNRPCPADLVWDDNLKRCEWTSSTCGHASDDGKHYRIARSRLLFLVNSTPQVNGFVVFKTSTISI